jgi:hypothetical protein
MKHPYLAGVVLASVVSMAMGLPRAAVAETAELDCKLRFSLTGWSLIYKHSEGTGVVSCANGKSMPVKVEAHGGGITVGKSHIDNGTGKFTDVHKIEDVLGTYAQGDASLGAGKSGTAQVLTKGTVSLALAGAGEGIDLGVSVGGFSITAAEPGEKKKK